MTLSAHSKLSIATIAYFVPALAVAIYVCLRHGFQKKVGFLYLILLALFRIVGSALQLSQNGKAHESTGILIAVAILNSIGLSPLLVALMGLLERVESGMTPRNPTCKTAFRLTHLAALIALVVASIAGNDQSHYNNPDKLKTGRELREAAAILLLAVYLILYLVAAYCVGRIRSVARGDRRLLYAIVVAAPFLLVRVVYSLCSAFAPVDSTVFGFTGGSVWAMALMGSLMEFVVVTVFLVGGVVTPAVGAGRVQEKDADVEEPWLEQQRGVVPKP